MLWDIVLRSVYISATATALAVLWSIPLSYMIAKRRLHGVASIFEALVGVPTVLIGLVVYMLFSRSGPLGFLDLLYTPTAIILGESLLVTPLIVGTSYRILSSSIEKYGELALSLGATHTGAMLLSLEHSIPGLVSSIIMAFSRAIGELGIALIVGGNIQGYTRTITTAIALEVSMGRFEMALQLGLVLVVLTIGMALAARRIERLLEGRA